MSERPSIANPSDWANIATRKLVELGLNFDRKGADGVSYCALFGILFGLIVFVDVL